MVQPTVFAGFSVVNVKFKVLSLVAQWIKQFASSPSSWVSFMLYWFQLAFAATPFQVFSHPHRFSLDPLSPFYQSLLLAWCSLGGSVLPVRSTLVMGSLSPHSRCPVAAMTTKSCYLYLLSENMTPPHFVAKFSPSFGVLYWSTTWRELFFFDMDRPVLEYRSWGFVHCC